MFQLIEVTTEQIHKDINLNPRRHHIVCCGWIGHTLAGEIAESIGISDENRHFLYHSAEAANKQKETTNLFPIAKLSLLPVDTTVWAAQHPNYMQEIITLTYEETEKSVRDVFALNEQEIKSSVLCFYLENAYCNYERIREVLRTLHNDNDFQLRYPAAQLVYLSCLTI